MIDIEIKCDKDWWDGGVEINEIVRVFANKCGLKEGRYSKYTPVPLYLEFECIHKKQLTDFKKRLKRSKKLIGVNLKITTIITE